MKLSCRQVASSASQLCDGELSFVSRLKVRLHLLVCEGCRRYVKQVGMIRAAAARAFAAPQADAALSAALLDELTAHFEKKLSRSGATDL